MQLFSRKKAILALSIGALSALGACGDDVTVTETVLPVTVTITPPSATMNIGESLNFAVSISGGSATTPPTLASCTSSNAAVATAAVASGACRVTAVASGNITVTAATTTGQAAAASVSVSPAVAAISNLTVSPTTANMVTGQKVTITPNVQKALPAVAVAYAYASSSTAVATVATNGEITAVAPGTATITTTATGTLTNFGSTVLTATTTVVVSSAPSGINGLTVQPAEMFLAVGSTAPLAAVAAYVTGSPVPVITFGTNNPSVATVVAITPNPTPGAAVGTVTAVAPGSAVITVTATTAASGNFAASTVTQLVPVTVSPAAAVSIHAINQGPIATAYYESFNSVQAAGGTNAAAVAAGYTYYDEAGIFEYNNPNVDQPVDILNVRDQIQVVVNLLPNGQRVDSVVVFIADAPLGTNRRAAARQLFSTGQANAAQLTMYINTADFTANFAAGTADVMYPNGHKIISVSAFTTNAGGASEGGNAANNRQTVNFNNLDGFAANHINPARVAQGDPNDPDKRNLNWWGGPGTTGEGRSTIIPIFYTPGRTLRVMKVGVIEGSNQDHPGDSYNVCGEYVFAGAANPTPSPLPHTVTYGTAPTATASIACDGYAHGEVNTSNFVGVLGTIDSYNNEGPSVTVASGYRRSAFVTRPVANRLDYQGPNTEDPDITRERPAVTGWVNAAFNFSANTDESNDYWGVGVRANSRAWMYQGCAAAEPTAMATATGADIPECPTDFLGGWTGIGPSNTRGPYVVMYSERDRLDNVSQSDSSWQFGVDKTVPLIRFSGASNADTARRVTASANAAWQAEFSDERSGFVDFSDDGAPVKTSTLTTADDEIDVSDIYTNPITLAQYAQDRSQQHFLSHGAGMLPQANYSTRSECLVPGTSNADVWRLTNPFTSILFVNPAATFLSNPGCTYVNALSLQGGDLGDGYRPGQAVFLPSEGIYRYDTRVYDRAGNASATLSRRMGVDLVPANFASLGTPLSVPLGGVATFQAAFEDATEVRAASLKLQYDGLTLALQTGLGATVSIAGTDTLVYPQVVLDARFNDIINGPAAANLTLPTGSPTVTTIEYTNASGEIVPNNKGTKMSAVGGTIWDFANRQDAQGGILGTPRVSTILGSGLADPIGFSTWTQSIPGLAFSAWTVLPGLTAGFNAGTGLKAQVTSSTNSINAPFARVDFYRRGTAAAPCATATGVATANAATAAAYNCSSNLYYIGSATSAASSDQGTTRYWTYLAPTTQAPTYYMAETATAPVAAFDNVVAVGVRLTGEALATQSMVIAGTAITLTLVLPAGAITPNVVFTQGATTVATRTSGGTFAVPAGNTTVTVNSVLVPLATCASGVASGSVTTPLSPNPVAAGPAASTVTVTYACAP